MSLEPLRPLVPLSVLALLGWCWYTFRKRRNAAVQGGEEEMVKEDLAVLDKQSLEKQEIATNSSTFEGEGLKTSCKNERTDSSSSYSDQSLELEVSCCSHGSGNLEETTSGMLGASPLGSSSSSQKGVLQKGVRPEPEGEVCESQASLLAEKSETNLEKCSVICTDPPEHRAGKKDLSWLEFDKDSSTQQLPCSKLCETTNLQETPSEKDMGQRDVKQVSSSLVKEVIHAATQEILVSSDGVLKWEDQGELLDAQDFSKNTEKHTKTLSSFLPDTVEKEHGIVSKTVEESATSVHIPESPSTSQAGEDSGCSTFHSEDWAGAMEASSREELCSVQSEEGACSTVPEASKTTEPDVHHHVAKKKGKLSAIKTDAPKGTVIKCVSGESRSSSSRTTQSMSSALTLWDIEVPAHLVGRLIGKQGKHIDFLKQNSGAKIYVSTLPYTQEVQICHIEGSKAQVDSALALVRKKFKDLDLSNCRCHVQAAPLPSLPITSWLLLPQDSTVEVIVSRVEAANYIFVQQHTHPSFCALQSLDEQMLFCYTRPGCPNLPSPVEAGVVCAAPSAGGGWWRAQVIQHYKHSDTVQIRYVDYGGYVTMDLCALRQIRSDFVTLPFQASEVMLENIAPLPGNEEFSLEARDALEEITQQVPLILKVTGSQNGLPLVHMWRQAGEELISVNGLLIERGFCSWLDSR